MLWYTTKQKIEKKIFDASNSPVEMSRQVNSKCSFLDSYPLPSMGRGGGSFGKKWVCSLQKKIGKDPEAIVWASGNGFKNRA